MAQDTKIEWCDHTINFWWGCSKVSPACANCYAEGTDARFHGSVDTSRPWTKADRKPIHWGPDAPRLLRVDAARREALRYERRAVAEGRRFRVFTNSMSDFFEDRADLVEARQEALDAILSTPHLDWLILTKRPENILPALREAQRRALGGDLGFAYTGAGTNALSEWLGWWLSGKPPANVWLGTTVEDQERADQRIPALLQVPAAVRFLSCEPLLGPVDLYRWLGPADSIHFHMSACDVEMGGTCCCRKPPFLDWVICGGESGPHARPMHPDWARGLRDQCAAAGVSFLFKQWGEWLAEGFLPPGVGTPGYESTGAFTKVGKKAAGRLLDAVEHNGYPEVG